MWNVVREQIPGHLLLLLHVLVVNRAEIILITEQQILVYRTIYDLCGPMVAILGINW